LVVTQFRCSMLAWLLAVVRLQVALARLHHLNSVLV
jgi:hypothetical protein